MESRVEGIVVEVQGDLIKVQVKRHGECSHCGSCGGDLGLLIEARSEGGVEVGSKVALDLPERLSLKSAFVVFLLPLVAVGIGFGIGALISPHGWLPAILSLAGAVASLLYLKRYDKLLAGRNELPLAEIVENKGK